MRASGYTIVIAPTSMFLIPKSPFPWKRAYGAFIDPTYYRLRSHFDKRSANKLAAFRYQHVIYSIPGPDMIKRPLLWNDRLDFRDHLHTYSHFDTTILLTGYDYQDVVRSMLFGTKPGDLNLTIRTPESDDVYVPCMSLEQTGLWVNAAFQDRQRWKGEVILAVGEHLRDRDVHLILNNATPQTIKVFEFCRAHLMNREDQVQEERRVSHYSSIKPRQPHPDIASQAWNFATWLQQPSARAELGRVGFNLRPTP